MLHLRGAEWGPVGERGPVGRMRNAHQRGGAQPWGGPLEQSLRRFFLVCVGLLGVSFPPTRTGISLQKSHVSSRIHPILSALLDYDTPNPASSSEDDGISNHRSLNNPFRDFLFLRVSKHNFLLFRKA